ncbi:conserved hypothetical protein [Nitrosopumilaceae archaeon]|nr:conserved hypothetical protein [Nitrosopumilaceae archaeon]
MISQHGDTLQKIRPYHQSYNSARRAGVPMAEASMAAFGSAAGVAVALAVVCFALRGKGHPEPVE